MHVHIRSGRLMYTRGVSTWYTSVPFRNTHISISPLYLIWSCPINSRIFKIPKILMGHGHEGKGGGANYHGANLHATPAYNNPENQIYHLWLSSIVSPCVGRFSIRRSTLLPIKMSYPPFMFPWDGMRWNKTSISEFPFSASLNKEAK